MSDAYSMIFSETQSSSGSDEEQDAKHQSRAKSRRAPLKKRPSLQKRSKPAPSRARAGKATDPFDDAALFKPSETMDEEMNAMKQVFLRMSEKKVQQKEERKAECKRLYKDAFYEDVEVIFRKAAKSRSKTLDTVSIEIDAMKNQLKTSSEELMSAHAVYKESFSMELTRAESEIDQLRKILTDLDQQYATAQKNVEEEYDQVAETMETSMQQLEVKLVEAYDDKSFFASFQPQVERLSFHGKSYSSLAE